LNDCTLIADATTKRFHVVDQGTVKWPVQPTVALRRVAIDLARGSRAGLDSSLKIVEIRVDALQQIVKIHARTPIQDTLGLCQSQGNRSN